MDFLRRRLGLIARTLISILLLAWIIRLIDWSKLAHIAQGMDPGWLGLALTTFIPVVLLVSWRWRLLLQAHGLRLPFWRATELNMVGQFFSAFLVGTTGGDIVKVFYVTRAFPTRRTLVALTVVIDRLVGVLALLFLGSGLAIWQWSRLTASPATRDATLAFFLFVASGAAVVVASIFGPWLLERTPLRGLPRLIPAGKGQQLIASLLETIRPWRTNLLAIIISLPSHLLTLAISYSILRALHLQVDLLPFCAMIAVVTFLIALPITISGVGLREFLFVQYFALLGIDSDHAIAFSLFYFTASLVWSLVGGVFYFLYRRETHAPAPLLTEPELVGS